jgi:hypothetical protein
MITIPELAAEALGSFLTEHMTRRFGSSQGQLIEGITSASRLALECIGNSDALYHNVEHTMLVTLVAISEPDLPHDEEGSLARAANIIGQLGDPQYLIKVNALFHEFEEIGLNKQFGYTSPSDLIELRPRLYLNSLAAHLHTAIRYLNVTSSGRQWIACLYSNVYRAEGELALKSQDNG